MSLSRDVHLVSEVRWLPEIDIRRLQPQFVTFSAQRYDPFQTPSAINVNPMSHHVHGISVSAQSPENEQGSPQATCARELGNIKCEGTICVRRKFHFTRRIKRGILEGLTSVYAKIHHPPTRSPGFPGRKNATFREPFSIELTTVTEDGSLDGEDNDIDETCIFLSHGKRLK